jgi:hypothetical protein
MTLKDNITKEKVKSINNIENSPANYVIGVINVILSKHQSIFRIIEVFLVFTLLSN